jgi:hypothetical protein
LFIFPGVAPHAPFFACQGNAHDTLLDALRTTPIRIIDFKNSSVEFSQNHQFKFRITLPEDGMIEKAHIICDDNLQEILSGHEEVLSKRLEQSKSIASFLVELKVPLTTLYVTLWPIQQKHSPPFMTLLRPFWRD